MASIQTILNKYSSKLDSLDLELIIAHAINKSREFVLAHPDYGITNNQAAITKKFIKRRMKHEPLAYILGEKEFYGLKFEVNKNVLIPRPETEILIEKVLNYIATIKQSSNLIILDVGTGSGNIIISIALQLKNFKFKISNFKLIGIDISEKALKTAKHNAKINKVNKKIKFIRSNLLEKISNSIIKQFSNLIIVANLPYLSPKIYAATPPDVKKYEPKSALFSSKDGLAHYEKLLKQIKELSVTSYRLQVFLEISPEQKSKITKIIKKYFPKSPIKFHKDIAGKWRVCEMNALNPAC